MDTEEEAEPTPEHQHYFGGILGGRTCTSSACWGKLVVEPKTQRPTVHHLSP